MSHYRLPWPYQSILSSSVNVSQCFGDQRVEPKGKQLELPTDLKRPGLGNSRQKAKAHELTRLHCFSIHQVTSREHTKAALEL